MLQLAVEHNQRTALCFKRLEVPTSRAHDGITLTRAVGRMQLCAQWTRSDSSTNRHIPQVHGTNSLCVIVRLNCRLTV